MRRLLPLLSALILIVAAAGTTLAWSDPDLESECAPNENEFAWSIWLPTESNYDMEFSWSADFSNAWDVTFPGNGIHEFTTARGGTTLYVRFDDDHNANDSEPANDELCEEPESPTPTPEGSQAGGTGTPEPSLPDTATGITGFASPLATVGFGLLLVVSLGALAYANVRTVRR